MSSLTKYTAKGMRFLEGLALLLVVLSLNFTPTVGDDSFYNVPTFTQNELTVSTHRRYELQKVLASNGLIAVEMDEAYSGYREAREVALSGLCSCSDESNEALFHTVSGMDTSMLSASLKRTTIATATVGNTPLRLPEEELIPVCGEDVVRAMDRLRDVVAEVSRNFVNVLDDVLVPNNKLNALLQSKTGEIYPTIDSIVKGATHLEHFHIYRKEEQQETLPNDFVLDVHTDAGLFLTFVPGFRCDSMENVSDFYVRNDKNGQLEKVLFPPNSVGILLGIGAEKWLHTEASVGPQLKATHHAVHMPEGQTRAWYGMMHLVPTDAVILIDPLDNRPRTFADMRKEMVVTSKTVKRRTFSSSQHVPTIGCGTHMPEEEEANEAVRFVATDRRRLQMVDDASVCNNSTNFYCWMSCLDIPDSENAATYLNEGFSLYCADPSILASTGNRVSTATQSCNERIAGEMVIGGAMNDKCVGVWQPTVPGIPSQNVEVAIDGQDQDVEYCYGGTSMYMDGFHWKNTVCVIYLFPSWVLTSSASVAGAAIGTILFGIALEGVIRKRRDTVQNMSAGWTRLGTSALFYGLQLTMGYLIMLVVMTYNGPLFLSVVIGLMGGHVIFNAKEAIAANKSKQEKDGKVCHKDLEETNDVCCDDNNKTACCESKSSLSDPMLDGTCSNKKNMHTSEAKSCCGSAEGKKIPKNDKAPCIPEGSTPCCQNVL